MFLDVQRLGRCLRKKSIKEAVATREREGFSKVGISIDRRTFDYTLQVYNDSTIRSLICCCCAQIWLDTGGIRSDIEFVRGGWLLDLKSLKKNFSKSLFAERYQRAQTPLAYAGAGHRNPDFEQWLLRLHPEVIEKAKQKGGLFTTKNPILFIDEILVDVGSSVVGRE